MGGARVMKAANTLGPDVLGSDPREAGGRRVIFGARDDADAKEDVVALFEDAGFSATTSATSRRAARCSRSTIRSPGST